MFPADEQSAHCPLVRNKPASRSFAHGGKGRRELEQDRLFDLLVAELPASVWEISKLTDVDRHKLSHHWRMMARAYEPQQFHVSRSGLSLLAAYILHLIDVGHTTIQT